MRPLGTQLDHAFLTGHCRAETAQRPEARRPGRLSPQGLRMTGEGEAADWGAMQMHAHQSPAGLWAVGAPAWAGMPSWRNLATASALAPHSCRASSLPGALLCTLSTPSPQGLSAFQTAGVDSWMGAHITCTSLPVCPRVFPSQFVSREQNPMWARRR